MIVGAQCGNAVLRGAHVYVPGIVSASKCRYKIEDTLQFMNVMGWKFTYVKSAFVRYFLRIFHGGFCPIKINVIITVLTICLTQCRVTWEGTQWGIV